MWLLSAAVIVAAAVVDFVEIVQYVCVYVDVDSVGDDVVCLLCSY